MSDPKSDRVRRIIGGGIIGLIAVIGVLIALSLYFVPGRPGAFFPFHFGWLGGIFLIFIVFWIAKWFSCHGGENTLTGTTIETLNQ